MTYLIRDSNDQLVFEEDYDEQPVQFLTPDTACNVARRLSKETGQTHTVVKVVDVAIYPGFKRTSD